jgi:superfamily II DNA/RNA helicase
MHQNILDTLQISALNAMQEAVLPAARQNDVVVLSPTGSGKTLAFLLAVLERLDSEKSGVQALVLVPSRELALQIEGVFKAMGTGYKVSCCYGGHAVKTEENALREAPALLIGTPGRIAYHARSLTFAPTTVHTLVLDEFDKSLEMGFQTDMAFIINKLSGLSRRIFTSATPLNALPDFTGAVHPTKLNFLESSDAIPQLTMKVVRTDSVEKLETLFSLLCFIGAERTLIFCNHRDAVERISDLLGGYGLIHAMFHGGMEQPDRERALMKFRNGTSRILVVTDLASRGLDIPEIASIVHYQLPLTEDAFIHRNGRTARMHATGTVYLLLAEDETPPYLTELPDELTLPDHNQLPPETEWETLYLSAGKKDKINKVDVVGLLLKKGNLEKEELGLIEVKDDASFAAVKRIRVDSVLRYLNQEKLKGKRVKVAIAN